MERTPGFTVQALPLQKDFDMPDNNASSRSITRRIAWLTGIACVACCTVPLLGVALGSASIAGLALYSEKAALVMAVIGVGALLFRRLTRSSGPSCNLDGSCKPAPSREERQQAR